MRTERLFIRPLSSQDWRSMQKLSADFRGSPYAVYDILLPTEENKIKSLTKQFANSKMYYSVLLDDVMIGYICFHNDNGTYNLGFCFHSNYHGKGYAFESCSAIMDHIAKERGITKFSAGTALLNVPSYNLLKKLGFVLKSTETLSFHKDDNGSDVTFEGGNFIKVASYGDLNK